MILAKACVAVLIASLLLGIGLRIRHESASDLMQSTNNDRVSTVIPLGQDEVSIWVPSTYNVSQPLTSEEHSTYVDGVAYMFAGLAGGATATEGKGFWIAQDGQLVAERVTIVSSFLNLTESDQAEMTCVAAFLAETMIQEAVLMKINSQSLLVSSRACVLCGSRSNLIEY